VADRADQILAGRGMFGMELGTERIRALLAALGDPQRRFRAIHVVGTNGKSSTTRFACAALAGSGVKAGAYLSPHITGWHERVLVAEPLRDPEPIGPEPFLAALEAAEAAAARVDAERGGATTQFELLTAAAFVALAGAGVEAAVVEAGLGGRLDATNVLDAPVVVLTGVGLDHTEHLGDTRELIAAEKLAVVTPGAVLVAGGMDDAIRPTVEAIATERGASRAVLLGPGAFDEDLPDLAAAGTFQRANATLALGAVAALLGDRLDPVGALRAISRTTVPGRLEVVGRYPLVIRDAAHNPDGARTLARELPRAVGRHRPVVGVIALLADKDADGVLAALAPVLDQVVVTQTGSERALGAERLLELALAHELDAEAVADPEQALARARHRAGGQGAVVVCGSLTLLAELTA
jgi:dihydrofolate synthase/folylpolyglutamate synthase